VDTKSEMRRAVRWSMLFLTSFAVLAMLIYWFVQSRSWQR
jgi:hypothetical protein